MSTLLYRYPGVRPFDREQSDRFFGRDEDIGRFLSMLMQEKLCVLYGISGYGKSSMLNAGIQPNLEAENAKGKRWYVPVPIRFLAASGKDSDDLFEQFNFHLERTLLSLGIEHVSSAIARPNTLWGRFKRWKIDSTMTFILLFDQFEELFSYPLVQQQMFRQQLAELLYSEYPQFLEENEERLSPEDRKQLSEKTNVHAVLAIRADRLSELDRLKDQLPSILLKRFELRALSRDAAEKALILPASLRGEFASPVFKFDAQATSKILDFLEDTEGQIDPIQLQILAESFEQRSVSKKIRAFNTANIGNLNSIISRYYTDKIATITDPTENLAVRRLCEEGLAQESNPPIRLSLHAVQIQQFFGIGETLLDRLINMRLLRAEAGKGGGATYELPHDTLLGAVMEAKRKRLEEEKANEELRAAEELAQRLNEAEAKAAEEQRRAQEAEQLKNEAVQGRKRARKFAWLAASVAIVAIAAMFWAFEAQKQAESARIVAQQKVDAFLVEERKRIEAEKANRQIHVESLKKKINAFINGGAFDLARDSLSVLEKLNPEDSEIAKYKMLIK